jgi:hypothetical protein
MNLIRIFLLYFFTISAAVAAPGAHGPDGEHLDAPGGSHVHTDAGPRMETFTESFELVGHLQESELSILIDRYETNEPVLNATLEVAFNGLTAPARFHADHGDYAVDDADFLKALAKPGKHSLVFTLIAGDESDLLEGALEVSPEVTPEEQAHGHSDDGVHEHAVSFKTWVVGGVLLSILLVVLVIPMLRGKRHSGK